MRTDDNITKSICFIYRSAHYALMNNTGTLVGGAEMQQKILAYALSEQGWRVSFVTEQIRGKGIIRLNPNLTLYPVINYTGGNKYIRKVLLLPFDLWKTLRHINADIYYQRNTNYPVGLVAMFCKLYRKKFVLAGANNWNFDRGNERNLKDPLEKLSANLAIRTANTIIVQNGMQSELLLKNYGRYGSLFYNVFPPKDKRENGRRILWVGRIVKHKRPEWFLELAKSLPMYNFVMVGGKGDHCLNLEIEKHAAEIENLKYLGHQSFETVEDLFDASAIFVGTYNPSTEGFPNTFLQAWSRGIPVVSSMDLDGLISENNLGILAETIPQMKIAIHNLMCEKSFMRYSNNIRNVFNRYFSVPNQIQNFIRIVTERCGNIPF